MKPAFLAIDTHAGKVTRYWPKHGSQRPAAFVTQIAQIYKLDGEWQLGGADGLQILEQFRLGKLDAELATEEKEYA